MLLEIPEEPPKELVVAFKSLQLINQSVFIVCIIEELLKDLPSRDQVKVFNNSVIDD